MMYLLHVFLQTAGEPSGNSVFNVSYTVSGAGTGAANGTYYAMMSPDVKDLWGNPVYMNTNGNAYLFAAGRNGEEYQFKLSSTYQPGGTDYYSWHGTAPQNAGSQTVMNGGTAPFPAIQ